MQLNITNFFNLYYCFDEFINIFQFIMDCGYKILSCFYFPVRKCNFIYNFPVKKCKIILIFPVKKCKINIKRNCYAKDSY